VSHDNADSSGENADGFAAKRTVGAGNIFRHCVAHHNSDDGWDFYTKADTGPIGKLTVEHSIAYQNGTLSDGRSFEAGDKNGFKLGGENIPVAHIVRGNLAFENGRHGFTYNRNPGAMDITDNIAINNRGRNFNFKESAAIFSDNLSCNTAPASNDIISEIEPREPLIKSIMLLRETKTFFCKALLEGNGRSPWREQQRCRRAFWSGARSRALRGFQAFTLSALPSFQRPRHSCNSAPECRPSLIGQMPESQKYHGLDQRFPSKLVW
ncbi:MAG: hypothetical protein WBG48_05450, partial [Pricia sp.]